MVTPVVYTTPAFSRSKTETLKMLQTPFYFENSGVVFQCKLIKTDSFENNGLAAHILSLYP